jgi:hypothetical protein
VFLLEDESVWFHSTGWSSDPILSMMKMKVSGRVVKTPDPGKSYVRDQDVVGWDLEGLIVILRIRQDCGDGAFRGF